MKMSMHHFNVFNEPKGNDQITTALICLDVNTHFFLPRCRFLNSQLYLQKYLINQNKNFTFSR